MVGEFTIHMVAPLDKTCLLFTLGGPSTLSLKLHSLLPAFESNIGFFNLRGAPLENEYLSTCFGHIYG